MRTDETETAPTITFQDLGIGYDTFAGHIKSQNNVFGQHSPAGLEVRYHCQFCETTDDVLTALDISSSISGNYDFIEKASAKVSYYQKLEITTHTLCVIVFARHLTIAELNNPIYNPDDPPPTPETALAFYQQYGDSFVSRLKHGGEFIASYTFYSQTIDEQRQITSELNANGIFEGGTISADFNEKMVATQKATTLRWSVDQYAVGYEHLPTDNILKTATYVVENEPDLPVVTDFAVVGYEEAQRINRDAIAGIIANRDNFNGVVPGHDAIPTLRNALYTLRNQTNAMQATKKIYGFSFEGYKDFEDRCQQIAADILTLEQYTYQLQQNPVVVIPPPHRGKDGLVSLDYGIPRYLTEAFRPEDMSLIEWGGHNNAAWEDVTWSDNAQDQRLYSLQFTGDAYLTSMYSQYMTATGVREAVIQHGEPGVNSSDLFIFHDERPVKITAHTWKLHHAFSSEVIITKIKLEFQHGQTLVFPTGQTNTEAIHEYDFEAEGRENQAFLGFQGRAKDNVNLIRLIIVQYLDVIWDKER